VLPERAEEALEDLALLRVVRHAHVDLAGRAWGLRDNFTAYDAMYLALAESLDATMVTCDAPLGAAPVHSARVEVIR
jgi:predicted nucleic acid-binding protein